MGIWQVLTRYGVKTSNEEKNFPYKGSVPRTLGTFTSATCGLSWSLDGQYLAAGSSTKRVIVFDAHNDFKGVFAYSGKAEAKALCFSKNYHAVGFGHADRHVQLFSLDKFKKVASFYLGSQVTQVRFSPYGKFLFATAGYPHNDLTILRLDKRESSVKLTLHQRFNFHRGQALDIAPLEERTLFDVTLLINYLILVSVKKRRL